MPVKRSIRAGRAFESSNIDRQPPGFKGVPVALHGALCTEFFDLISFAGGQGGPNDQDIVVSTPLYNLHIMKNFISHISEKTSPDFGI